MQAISPEYKNETFTIKPGDRFHRLIALMTDTWYDDLTDQKITELEQQVESFRWMNAKAEKVSNV